MACISNVSTAALTALFFKLDPNASARTAPLPVRASNSRCKYRMYSMRNCFDLTGHVCRTPPMIKSAKAAPAGVWNRL
jgi:hypothetical protein